MTEQANVKVNVNGQEAKSQLDALQGKAKELKLELQNAFKAGDVKGYNKIKRELSGIKKESKSIHRQMFDVDKVIRNLGGSTLKDLTKAQQQLNRQLTTGSVKRNSKEWNVLTGKLKLVNAEMTKVRMQMKATQSLSSRLADGFNKYSMLIMSFAASILGIVMAMRKAVDAANEYESSLANLSALTGLVGENLEWLSKQALDLSGSVDEAGVRISTSAKDILEAYTQMGSKRPELLKDKEALAAVTKEAIILSEAAKMELVPATNSLAISMNQFNASAEEAPRYINAIAAGSKVGAGNVLYIAEALENTGTAMNGANLSIETGIGLIETLAPKFSKASKAGINLRNIITKMRAGADEFNPAIVGMEQSLDNLADANLSVNTLTEMFTIRNLSAIQVLIESRKEFVNYRDAVTDSNVAVEQAIINTSTNAAKLDGARARLNKVAILLGQKLAPALTFSTNAASYMIKAMLALSEIYKEHKISIVTTVSAITAWTIVTKLQAKWDAIHYGYLVAKNAITKAYALTVWTVTDASKMAAFWQKAWNWAIKANPIGMLATVVVAAATAIYLYSKRTKEAARQQIILNEAAKEGVDIWKDTKPLEERAAVMDKMNKKQLEAFKSDALLQLAQIEKLDELKLVAQNNYDNEIEALRVLKNRKHTYGELLKYQNDAKKAKEHLDHMTKLVKESNADQIQSYIDTATELLNISPKVDDQFTSIKELKEEINRLVAAKDLIDIADKDAIAQAQINIDAKKAELKVYEDLGKAVEETSKKKLKEFDPTKLDSPDSYDASYNKMKAETLKKYRDDDLQNLQDAFNLETTLRETEHNKALAALGANEEARAKLDKEFKEEEALKMITHLESLTQLLYSNLNTEKLNELSIADAILSDEEKEALAVKIADLQLLIAKLKAEISGTAEESKESYGGVIAKYLFGDDWETFDLADKIKAIGDIAIKTLGDINQIISNGENQQLMDFKNKLDQKKVLLNKQLDSGIISYEEYTARTAQLDEDLDRKKRRIDHDQAVRAKALAIMSVILSTAAGVARAFEDYSWPFSMAVAAIVGALGAVQIGVAASEPVPAYAQGRYPVTAQDGNTYNASYYGKPTTSEIVKGPALISELEDEMIVDGATTRSLSLNYPHIIDGIKQLSAGGIPQFADGNYPVNTKEVNTETFTDPAMLEMLTKINNRLEQPSQAYLVADEDYIIIHNDKLNEYTKFQNKVN